MIVKKARHPFAGFLTALLTPVPIALVLSLTWPVFEHNPTTPFLFAIIISAWYGGLIPGLVCIAISLLLSNFLYIEPYYSFGIPGQDDWVRIVTVVAVGIFVSFVCEWMQRAQLAGKESSAAAELNEAKFRTMVNTIPQLAWMAHADGHIYWYNDQWYEYTGTTLEEMEGWGWKSVHDAEVLPQVMKRWERAIETGEPFEMTFPLRRADGEFRNFLTRIQPLKDASGKVISWFGTNTDVDELQHLERAAGESESRYRTLFDRAPDGIVIANAEGSYIDANETICRMLGYTRDEMLSLHVSDVTTPEEVQHIQPAFDEVRSTKDYRREWVLKRKDGSTFTADVVATEMPDGSAIGIIRDITDRRRAEEALRDSEEKFRALADHSLQGIVLVQDDATVFVNPAYCEITGYSYTEAIAHTAQERVGMVHPDDSARVIDRQRRFKGGETIDEIDEVRVRRKNGEERWLLASHRSFLLQGKPAQLEMIVDITERRRAEDKLKASEASLAEAQSIAHIGNWELDLSTMTGWCSAELFRLIYQDPSSKVPNLAEFVEFVHPDDRRLLEEAMVPTVDKTEPYSFEFRTEPSLGPVKHLYATVQIVRDASEKPVRIVGTTMDITGRKLLEAELLKDKQRLAGVIGSAMDAIVSIDDEQKIVLFNTAAEKMFGVKAADAIGDSLDRFIPERFRPGHHLHVENFGKTNVTRRSMRSFSGLFGLRANGEEFPIEASISQIVNDDKRLFTVILRDVTEREKAETALRDSEEKFRALADNSLQGIVLVQREAIRFVNSALCDLTGYSKDEMLALTPAEQLALVHPEDAAAAAERRRRFAEGEKLAAVDEFRLIRKDGQVRWISAATKSFSLKGEPARLSILLDITERKAAEAKLKESTDRLRALSARLNLAREEEGKRIAREIHDELGGALTGMKWDIEGIDKTLAESLVDEKARTVRGKLSGISGLVDSTIDTVRRISSDLRPTLLDDLGLVPTIEWQASQFKKRTGIQCTFSANSDAGDINRGGATAVFRILQEVLTNIIRHAKASNVAIELSRSEGWLELSVQDNGRGITESEKADARSIGLLGMSERARLVGGVVEITGALGEGTLVRIRVPLGSPSRSNGKVGGHV